MSEKQTNTPTENETNPEIIESVEEIIKEDDSIETTTISEKKLGNYLKNLREKNQVTVKQLSIDTKINESVLVNLEEENFTDLPRKIYLVGFIKTYTAYFKTNPNDALEILNEVFTQNAPKADVHGRFENHDATNINTAGLIKFAVIIIALIISIFFIKKFFFSPMAEVINPEITTEKIDSNTPLVGSPSNIELSQESSEVKTESIKPAVKKETKVSQKEELEQNENEEGDQLPTEISFKNFPANYLSYLNTSKDDITRFIPENILGANEGVSEKIIISASEDKTWLAYQKDNEEIKQLILKEGKVLVISGNEVRMVVGNSNSIRLIHNQKEVDIKSKTGIKSLVFPLKSAKKYQLPLFYQNSNGEYVSSGVID